MKTIHADREAQLLLGKSGESGAVEVVFDIDAWQAEYPEGSPMMIAQRPGDADPYPVQVTVRDAQVVWTPTAADTARSGYGMCELRWVFETIVVKSRIWKTIIAEALPDENVPPEPYIPWVNEVLHAADTVKKAIVHPPYIGTDGDWFFWDTELEEYVDSGISSKPSFVVVGNLPATGDSGKIYLLPNGGTGTNRFDEYIWVEARWEKIGTTEIDLSGYAKSKDIRVFYGTAPGGDTVRQVTLDAGSAARWDRLKDGDVLICRFTYKPMATGLSITVSGFGTKNIFTQVNLSTGSRSTIKPDQWRYGSIVPLVYVAEADAWLMTGGQVASDGYMGIVKISDDYSIGDSQTAASTVALQTLNATMSRARLLGNLFSAFTLKDMRTAQTDVFIAPMTWNKFLASHLNPLVETADGMKKLFRTNGSTGVGIMYDPDQPDVLAPVCSDSARTRPVTVNQSITLGATYYYRSEE